MMRMASLFDWGELMTCYGDVDFCLWESVFPSDDCEYKSH